MNTFNLAKHLPVCLLASVATFLGCNRSSTVDDRPRLEAQDTDQLRQIAKETTPAAEPWQLDITGKVVEVLPSAVKLKTDAHPEGIVMATTPKVQVFEGGEQVGLSTLQPGDQITVMTERTGNRADGWQSIAVQINVGDDLQAAEEKIGEARDGDTRTLNEEPGYEVHIQGQFVEANASTITLRSADSTRSTLPIDPAVIVYRGAKSGGISLLQAGDLIEVTTEQRGNRQDGWIHVVSKITAIDPN